MKSLASGRISLTKVFSDSIHLPTRREDTGVYPLYPHKASSEVAKRTVRSSGWYTESRSNFNSPSNIRLVCLDQSSAYVSYWNTPVEHGRKKDIAIPLSQQYLDGDAPVLLDPVRLYSNNAGLGCLVRDYVCPNIEELWITAEVFGIAGTLNPAYNQFYQQLRSLNPGQVVVSNELLGFLSQEIKRDVRATFPLLRCIVVVVKPLPQLQRSFYGYARRTKEVSTYLNETSPDQRRAIGEVPALMNDIASKSGFGLALCVLPGADISKFSLGDYKYDEAFLVAVKDIAIKKYTPSVKSEQFVAESVEEQVADRESPTEFSLLQIIEELEEAGYSTAAINTALFAYRNIDVAYLKEQVEKLPHAVVKKYAGSLGGDLTGNQLLFTKNRKARLFALAKLATEPPTEHLHNMIMSAYTASFFELDTKFIEKYKSVYYALFDISTVAVIQSRLSRDGYTSGTRIHKIRQHLQGGTNADIVPLISAMQFSLTCGNPSGFADFDTKDDTDLTFDPKHIVEQCALSVMESYDILYADVYSPSKAPKGAYSLAIPGYPEGILCHNTAHNKDMVAKKGNDSLLRLRDSIAECLLSFYSKTICNAVQTVGINGEVTTKKLGVESGAVRAELLGGEQTFYFPRKAGHFASGVVIGRQVRYGDSISFKSAVRRWLNNRLMPVYTYYSSRSDTWETAEAVRRAAKSLSNAFIVTEYEENGIQMLRIHSNMFVVESEDLKELSTDNYTVLEVVQTKTEDFSVYTITVALKGGLDYGDINHNIEKESEKESKQREEEQQALDTRANLIYQEVAKVLSEKGYKVSGFECTQSALSRVFGLENTTHKFEVVGGVH